MNAEAQGKAGKKGQWSSREPPKPHSNDVSLPGTSGRAKQHLPFLQRAGKVPAVCEYVLSGHRIKLHIPKEGVTLAFNPSGVRCPQRGMAASAGRPATEVRRGLYCAAAVWFLPFPPPARQRGRGGCDGCNASVPTGGQQ